LQFFSQLSFSQLACRVGWQRAGKLALLVEVAGKAALVEFSDKRRIDEIRGFGVLAAFAQGVDLERFQGDRRAKTSDHFTQEFKKSYIDEKYSAEVWLGEPMRSTASLLCYRPESFHSSDKIFGGFPRRQKLRVNRDLRCAEFPRRREIFTNLLERPGKLGPFFFNGLLMNFDARCNNELERGGIATGRFCHLLDVIKHRSDAAQRNTHRQPGVRRGGHAFQGGRRECRHIDWRMRFSHGLWADEGFCNPIMLALKLHRIGRPDFLEDLDLLIGAFAAIRPSRARCFVFIRRPSDAESRPQPSA
jgi:hypothetical protein